MQDTFASSRHGVEKLENLVDLITFRAELHPDRLAYSFLADGESNEIRLTYGELWIRAKAIASHLQSLGMAGERALLFYPSGIDYLEAFWGCLFAESVAVPLYPPRPNRSYSRFIGVVADAEAKVILTTSSICDQYQTRFDSDTGFSHIQWIATDRIPSEIGNAWRTPRLHPHSLAYLQYTSGSTANPRGVMVSHRNLLVNSRCYQTYMSTEEGDIHGAWLPLYHDMGLIGFAIQGPYIGGSVYWLSPFDFLKKPVRWLKMVSTYRIQCTGAPNFAFDLCSTKISREQREGLDLRSLRMLFNGSEHIRACTCERFLREFTPYGLNPHALTGAYGMAECTLIVSCGNVTESTVISKIDSDRMNDGIVQSPTPTTTSTHQIVSSGRILEEYDIRIVDPQTRLALPPNHTGEIWISHPSVAQGYWNQAGATERTFQATLADTGEGPYLRTGDLGVIWNDQLYVTGRLKELIIIEGRNHYPQDIELTVEQVHPSIRATGCAAFSIEIEENERLVIVAEIDPRWKIQDKNSASNNEPNRDHRLLDVNQLIKDIRKAVSEIHDIRPYRIELLKFGQILKTTSGKIQRQACRQAYLDGTFETIELDSLSSPATQDSGS